MAHSCCIELRPAEREQLLGIARQSLCHGLERGRALEIDPRGWPDVFTARHGVFVTLTRHGTLRGCIGAMESNEPLARSVAESAYGAAFRDPRFEPLQPRELDEIRIDISILSGMEAIPVASRGELLSTLRPARDGLLLQDRHYRSTFLPKVWEQLPDPDVFIDHLLAKAGLPGDHWSATLQFFRYQTVSFGEADPPCVTTGGD